MDIIGGLTAARLAVNLAKDLREIDRSVDEATFRLKLAELTSALADAHVALSEAKLELNKKDAETRSLSDELRELKEGAICPKCRKGNLEIIESHPLATGALGRFGVEEQMHGCDKCEYKTVKIHDPQGLVAKYIAKR